MLILQYNTMILKYQKIYKNWHVFHKETTTIKFNTLKSLRLRKIIINILVKKIEADKLSHQEICQVK